MATDRFEQFINSKIASGRFSNTSEIIRAGLRLLENEGVKLEALKRALIEGEESGFITDFDGEKLLEHLHSKNGFK